jgi:hypothetical protein
MLTCCFTVTGGSPCWLAASLLQEEAHVDLLLHCYRRSPCWLATSLLQEEAPVDLLLHCYRRKPMLTCCFTVTGGSPCWLAAVVSCCSTWFYNNLSSIWSIHLRFLHKDPWHKIKVQNDFEDFSPTHFWTRGPCASTLHH